MTRITQDYNPYIFTRLLKLLQEELAYLGAHLKLDEVKLPVAPYLEILKTRGFWALQFTWLFALWGNFTLWTVIPLYLNNIQHFSLNAVRPRCFPTLHLFTNHCQLMSV